MSEKTPADVIAKLVSLAQGTVDTGKIALQPWLPLCLRLKQIEIAKTLNLTLQRELLEIEKALIDEGAMKGSTQGSMQAPMQAPMQGTVATSPQPASHDTQQDAAAHGKPPSWPGAGAGATRVQPWELN